MYDQFCSYLKVDKDQYSVNSQTAGPCWTNGQSFGICDKEAVDNYMKATWKWPSILKNISIFTSGHGCPTCRVQRATLQVFKHWSSRSDSLWDGNLRCSPGQSIWWQLLQWCAIDTDIDIAWVVASWMASPSSHAPVPCTALHATSFPVKVKSVPSQQPISRSLQVWFKLESLISFLFGKIL